MRIKIGDKINFSRIIDEMFDYKINPKTLGSITIDSRKVELGDVFIALKGNNQDAHDFIDDDIIDKASLIINEKFFNAKNIIKIDNSIDTMKHIASQYRMKMNCKVIGVTGSNGKTTTKEILFHVLKNDFSTSSTSGNYNSTIGMPMSLFSISAQNQVFIAEMGTSSKGEIKYLSDIAKPDIGIITNISEAHLENFNSIDEVFNEKIELFKSLREGGTAFINMDDPYISSTQLPQKIKTIKYGFKNNIKYSGYIEKTTKDILLINNQKIDIEVSSKSLMQNILGAYSIVSELGVNTQKFNNYISCFNIPDGRGQLINKDSYLVIDDTYNSNYTSTVLGIESLSNNSYKGMRKILVLGDMLELGSKKEKFHQDLLAHIISNKIDIVFLYGELMENLYKVSKNKLGVIIKYYNNQKLLIDDLNNVISDNDIIYVKGSRGMKMENIIKGLK